jgi:hypothetical protein
MKDTLNWMALTVVTALVSAALGLAMAFPTMWLWNLIIPGIFGLKAISWTEALCLYVLCNLLFNSSSLSSSVKKDN